MRRPCQRTVVLACDEAYQPAACVCLMSAFVNSPDIEFRTYLVTDAPNDRLTAAVRRLSDTFIRDIRIAAIEPDQARGLVKSLGPVDVQAHITSATMLRLAIPDLLPIESFLYLDCDIVVQDSLGELLSIDLGDNLVAAATDGLNAANGHKHLRLAPSEPYINTGVLVVNARAWRDSGGLRRVGQICRDHRGRLGAADQDIVNMFCLTRKLLLERRWNTLQHDFLFSGDWSSLDVAAFRGIFHFCSEMKPWMAWAPPPTRELYGRYAAVAPWSMPDVTTPRNDRERKVLAMSVEYERIRKSRPARP
jgi:lipopolysaccharide biosynthesis glycosyltransferase